MRGFEVMVVVVTAILQLPTIVVAQVGEADDDACNLQRMDECNKDMLIYVEDTSIPEDLAGFEAMCQRQKRSYVCSRAFTDRCTEGIPKGVITLVLEGMKDEVNERCDNTTDYHAKYWQYVPCINSVGDRVHRCARWAAESVYYVAHVVPKKQRIKTMCCYFPRFVECMRKEVEPVCGTATAKYAEEFINVYAGEVLEFACGRSRGRACSEAAEIPEDFNDEGPASPAISSVLKLIDSLVNKA